MDKKTKGIMVLEMKERLPDLLDIVNKVTFFEECLWKDGQKDAAYWMSACKQALLKAVDNYEGSLAYLEHHAEKTLGEEV